MQVHELAASRPFDFAKSLSFLCSFAPTRDEQRVEHGTLTKAFSHRGRAVVARVEQRDDRLLATLDEPELLPRLREQLGLDDDVEGFYAKADRAFRPVIARLHGLHHVRFGTGAFEAACWAVLVQRTRIPIARAQKARLVSALGPTTDAFGATFRAFPEPEAVLEAGADRLRDWVGPRGAALFEIARAFANVDPRFLREGPYDFVESWLRDLPRVGPWSAAFVLFRALGRMEHTPVDIGPIARAAQTIYGGTEKEALSRAEHYGEHRGYWCYYLRAGVG